MKYCEEMLTSTYSTNDFIFFWGHTPATSSEITQTCLSQWWKCYFTEGGITFCCAEQYMMYKKALLFEDYEHADEIPKTKDPKNIKALGRLVKGFDNKVQNEHKAEIVLQGNILKFSQNPELKQYLLGTRDKILVEASPYDRVWGIGMRSGSGGICEPQKWKGENLLGFLLMEARDMIEQVFCPRNNLMRIVFFNFIKYGFDIQSRHLFSQKRLFASMQKLF